MRIVATADAEVDVSASINLEHIDPPPSLKLNAFDTETCVLKAGQAASYKTCSDSGESVADDVALIFEQRAQDVRTSPR